MKYEMCYEVIYEPFKELEQVVDYK